MPVLLQRSGQTLGQIHQLFVPEDDDRTCGIDRGADDGCRVGDCCLEGHGVGGEEAVPATVGNGCGPGYIDP